MHVGVTLQEEAVVVCIFKPAPRAGRPITPPIDENSTVPLRPLAFVGIGSRAMQWHPADMVLEHPSSRHHAGATVEPLLSQSVHDMVGGSVHGFEGTG